MSIDETNAIAIRRAPRPAERIDPGLEGLEAGQYWSATRDIPEYVGEDHERDAVAADTVLLVSDLRFLDGFLHTVVLAPHPTEHAGGSRRFLAEDFLTTFHKAPDAEAVRAAEIGEIHAAINRIQSEMIAGPPNTAALADTHGEQPDVSTMVALSGRSGSIAERSAEMRLTAEVHRDWIGRRTKDIVAQTTLLTRFYTEKSLAAQAAISETMERASRLERGARSLVLYTGEGIDIRTVATGAEAPADAPLSIYQRRLFLDEETAVEVGSAGIDMSNFNDIEDIFARTPGLIDRIAPAPRSVVLMRLRRKEAEQGSLETYAQIMHAIAKDKLDKQSFLLVRNGENVHIVHSDMIWSFDGASDDFDANGLKRLFPSRDDLDQPFRGAAGRSIDIGDLDFSDARRRFDDRALAYKRLLVLMWGLNDREQLFGSNWGGPADWTDMDWQAEHLSFVDDEGMALTTVRESWADFTKSRNALLQPGSRIWVDWRMLIDPEVAPGLYAERDLEYATKGDRYRKPYCAWKPASEQGPTVVTTRKGATAIRFPVVHKDKDLEKQAWIETSELANAGRTAYLVLDGVRSEDLTWFIENRKDRESYSSYLELFIGARKFLREDEARQEPAIEEIVSILDDSGMATDTPEVRMAIADAIRLWRAANKAADAPRRDDAKAFGKLLKLVWIGIGRDIDFEKAVDDLAERERVLPLRLSVDGDGDLHLYAETPSSDRIDILGGHVWVSKIPIVRTIAGLKIAGAARQVRMKEIVPEEKTLVQRAESLRWIGRKSWDGGIEWEKLEAVLADIDSVSAEEISRYLDGSPVPIDRESLYERVTRFKEYYHDAVDVVPIGLAVFAEQHVNSYAPTVAEPVVLLLADDPVKMRARHPDGGMEDASKFVASLYRNPAGPVASMAKAADTSTATIIAIPLTKWTPGTRHDVGGRTVAEGPHKVFTIFGESYQKATPWRDQVSKASRFEIGAKPRKATVDEVILAVRPDAAEVLDRLEAGWMSPIATDKSEDEIAAPTPR